MSPQHSRHQRRRPRRSCRDSRRVCTRGFPPCLQGAPSGPVELNCCCIQRAPCPPLLPPVSQTLNFNRKLLQESRATGSQHSNRGDEAIRASEDLQVTSAVTPCCPHGGSARKAKALWPFSPPEARKAALRDGGALLSDQNQCAIWAPGLCAGTRASGSPAVGVLAPPCSSVIHGLCFASCRGSVSMCTAL